MILNQADNVMLGDVEVLKICLGDDVVWERSKAFIILDTTRFSADEAVLYNTQGNVIATVTIVAPNYGTLNDIYASSDGLHITGVTEAWFETYLPFKNSWTIIYKIKDYQKTNNYNGFVHEIFMSDGGHLETAMVDNWNSRAMHYRLTDNFHRSSYYETYNGVVTSNYNGFYDEFLLPSEMLNYELEYRWINDGTTLSLYVNGIKKAIVNTEHLSEESINVLVFASSNHLSNKDLLTVSKFEVREGVIPPEYVLYKMSIHKIKGTEWYTQFSEFNAYDENKNKIDLSKCVSFALTNSSFSEYPTDMQRATAALDNNIGTKMCVRYYSDRIVHFIFSVTKEINTIKYYSYTTGDDVPNRDPVSWELQKSTDGGVTWKVVDERTDVSITDDRNTETDLFSIGD